MFWVRSGLLIATLGIVSILVAGSMPRGPRPHPAVAAHRCLADPTFRATVERVNDEFRADWARRGLTPADRADIDTLRRRLSLGLAGTLPSFEEHQQWSLADGGQATEQPAERLTEQQIAQWVDYVLNDRRSSDYVAERFARALVGTDTTPFLLFRRRRFVSWLSDSLAENRPYDQLVRQLITENGLRTDRPAVNFITATLDQNNENQPDEIRLAARTARAFLGVRLDCVQCHDDNLGGSWTQADFHQLAAFYSECRLSVTGIHDQKRGYEFQYLRAEKPVDVQPRPPFATELLEESGTRRQQLATWVTHPENKAFSRATVNRVWAILFGKPLVDPIDSIPLEGPYPPGLEILAEDFSQHGYDLRRLIHLIAATEPFQVDSRAEHELTAEHEQHWACFPVVRLRPEQVVGSTLQACALNTVDSESHVLVRLMKFGQEQDFIKRYGDAGADEFVARGGTIPQRLLMMNGKIVHERTGENIVLNASTRIAALSRDHRTALNTVYRCVLGRQPTEAEREYFLGKWDEQPEASFRQAIEDLYWVLLNSAEFSWNH